MFLKLKQVISASKTKARYIGASIVGIGFIILCLTLFKPSLLTDKQFETYKEEHTVTVRSKKEKAKALKQEKEYFLYLYYDGCGYCEEFKDSLKEYLSNPGIPVYFLDTEDGNIDILYSEKETKGKTETDWYIDGTPTILHIKNGKIVHLASGVNDAIKEVKHV